MQHNKSSKQIEKVSDKPERVVENINDISDKFKLKESLKKFDLIKRSGTHVSKITQTLLLLPFSGMLSVAAFFNTGLNDIDSGAKNAYYNVKNNSKINWRFLLILMAQRFKSLVSEDNALILDIEQEK